MRFETRAIAICLSIGLLSAGFRAGAGDAAKVTGEDLLPDTTLLAVVIPDMAKAREAFAKTRAGEMFAQPEMQAFLSPILEELRRTHAVLKAGAPMLPALGDLDRGIFSGELTAGLFVRQGPPGLLLTYRPDDPAAFVNALKPFFDGQAMPENTPIPVGPGPEPGGMMWTQGRFLLCSPPISLLQTTADRIKNGAVAVNGSLAGNADYVAAKKKLTNPLGWFQFRPAAVVEIMRVLEEPDTLWFEQAWEKLGIKRNSALLAGVSVANGELIGELCLANLDRAMGIGAVFGPQPPISAAALKIAAPGAPFVSAGNLNFSAVIPWIRRIAEAEPRELERFDQEFAQAREVLGFDLQRDLFESFGSEWAVAVTPFDTGLPLTFAPGTVASLALKDAGKVEACLQKLEALAKAALAAPGGPGLIAQVKSSEHGGKRIRYLGGIAGGGLAVCIAGDRLLMANSLNAMRRSLEQLERKEDITSNKEFQEALARVSGRPFDAANLPGGFSFAKDQGSGGGELLATMLGVAAGTGVLAGIAEATAPPQQRIAPPPLPMAGNPMAEVQAFLQRPAGQVVLSVATRTDLGLWPDEGFFMQYRRAKAGAIISDPTSFHWRTELPPPIPGLNSGGSAMPVIAVTSIAAGLILPVLARARESARRTSSASNMNQFAKACYMYADVPANGDFPADPAALYPNYVADPRVFSNPRFGDQAVGYIYVSGVSINDATSMVMYENVPEQYAAQGRNVLIGAGTIEFVEDAKFKELLKEVEATIKKRGGTMKLVPIDKTEIGKRGREGGGKKEKSVPPPAPPKEKKVEQF